LSGGGVESFGGFRDAVERMPVQEYLAASYYERWFHAIETLLVEKGVLTEEEVHGG
jgi:nitrile hydratase subunit beta